MKLGIRFAKKNSYGDIAVKSVKLKETMKSFKLAFTVFSIFIAAHFVFAQNDHYKTSELYLARNAEANGNSPKSQSATIAFTGNDDENLDLNEIDDQFEEDKWDETEDYENLLALSDNEGEQNEEDSFIEDALGSDNDEEDDDFLEEEFSLDNEEDI